MLLVHIGITSYRQFQCAPTTYVHSINEGFSHKKVFFTNFSTAFYAQCKEHVEMNKFLCSLACTWRTIIDSQFYIIDSLSLAVSLELKLTWWSPETRFSSPEIFSLSTQITNLASLQLVAALECLLILRYSVDFTSLPLEIIDAIVQL